VLEVSKNFLAHHVVRLLSSVTETTISDIYFLYPGVLEAIFRVYPSRAEFCYIWNKVCPIRGQLEKVITNRFFNN